MIVKLGIRLFVVMTIEDNRTQFIVPLLVAVCVFSYRQSCC